MHILLILNMMDKQKTSNTISHPGNIYVQDFLGLCNASYNETEAYTVYVHSSQSGAGHTSERTVRIMSK